MKKHLFTIFLTGVLAVAISSCNDDDSEPVRNVLITSNRSTGQFYQIDVTTGTTTPLFKITYNGETLYDIRGFVYHPKLQKYFASVNSYENLGDGEQNGTLYSIDPATKVATQINDNDGKVNASDPNQSYEIWDAIVNWAVASDDSLVAVGDFNGNGNGFVKFGTNGGRSLKTTTANVCCGLGMIYDAETGQAWVGNDPNDGEVYLEQFDTQTGESLDDISLTTFEGFPDDFNEISATSWMPLKGMATNSEDPAGTIYGLLFNNESASKKTYFVILDLDNSKVKYVSTLGLNVGDQYNSLTFVPSNKL